MSPSTTPYVAVIGGSEYVEEDCRAAEEVGATLAQAGALVLCGGRSGVMEAVCRGAKQHGGTTIGFLPGESRGDKNEYVDIALPTGLGEMRNMLIVNACDVVIAVGGELRELDLKGQLLGSRQDMRLEQDGWRRAMLGGWRTWATSHAEIAA